ncbi:MAG TPA: nitrile hydratase subunit beta [Candidatus Binataceae bacterium]|nr:nitrile hydratase subunit beta [Candidatus Binataceae bacterium]
MNGVHDLGGMHGFGPVVREQNEPVFHADWEKRTFAMTLTAMGRGVCNVDEFRRAIERMPPASYLAASYYEKWLHAVEALLVEKGVVTREELASGHAAAPAPPKATGPLGSGGGGVESFDDSAVKLRFNKSFKPGFKVGDRVVARNLNPEHHTRLPRYAHGKRGVIRHDQGVFVFPDTHAHGQGNKPQHVYTVVFEAKELWGPDHNERAPVYLDCWEDYLERDRIAARPAVKSSAKTAGQAVSKTKASPAKLAAKGPAVKPAAKSASRSRAAAKKGRKR